MSPTSYQAAPPRDSGCNLVPSLGMVKVVRDCGLRIADCEQDRPDDWSYAQSAIRNPQSPQGSADRYKSSVSPFTIPNSSRAMPAARAACAASRRPRCRNPHPAPRIRRCRARSPGGSMRHSRSKPPKQARDSNPSTVAAEVDRRPEPWRGASMRIERGSWHRTGGQVHWYSHARSSRAVTRARLP